MERETFDCVVVGAGWYGLGAAKQYHFTHPSDSLVVFDGQETLGGTWAAERLYPGLKSNNLWGTYEYPDFPMTTARFGVEEGSHVPGTVVHDYLKAYAAEFGIAERIRLRTKVLSAEHQDGPEGGWVLTISSESLGEQRVFARRLIVATGQTSDAFLPHFDGEETFGGRIFHGKHFPQNRDTLGTAKSAVVLGGTKFAWDAAYAYATAGVETHMVIRSSGHGPVWMAPTHVTPLKKWIEKLANTRLLTWFSPCIWGEADGYPGIRNFLHGTALGRKIVDIFWGILGNDVLTLNKFDSHPETAKLKPWLDAMFVATSFSLLNYETDFFQLVKDGKIRVHISDITGLSPGKVHLSDGTQLTADVLLAVTGWKQVPPLKFLPEGIEKELGLPHFPDPETKPTPEDLASQQDLLAEADAQILTRFPRLKHEPVWNKAYIPLTQQKGVHSTDAVTPCTPLTPFMLHRFMVPPSARFLRTRDVAFAGFVSNFSNIITAHLQGLWIGAYFKGLLVSDTVAPAPSPGRLDELRRETVLHNRFGRWRYPVDWGNSKVPSFIFDAVPYLDLLQRDLGIDHRRKRGVLAQVLSPYGPEDYRTVNEEWAARQRHFDQVAS
ncbi:FAD/NAD(P)-binding domain-containing protein [Parathielavia appendiculata]|uniref:FAD/NAD(P)-binding domain-containing protein n=1 Tax=Parathielavia appendiculata TaxID=2587402 RepID=A0AAN6U2D4_9PEZI|nr:FAD/NAD(P)-binding domain-containing protein [Parathielavia appendiculata]